MKRLLSLITLMILCSLPGYSSVATNLPVGFVDVKVVIPDIQLELRYCTEDNFVGQRISGYEKPRCILTKKAATALKKVQDELKTFGLGLKVYDAYRPQQAVDHFVRWAKDLDDTKMKSKYYPSIDKKNLFKDGYIVGKSGHSRGSTVDITIVTLDSKKSEELDMGTGWDFFGPRSWPGSMTVSSTQRANRMLLQNVMKKHGFNSLKEEWWHFTLKNETFPNKYFNFLVK